jgi:anti-sigma B factor antagonist
MADFGITASGPAMFTLKGELDLASSPLLDAAIGQSVARGGSILVDVSGLTFADSSGIGAILRSARALPTGCLVLHGVREQMGRVIDVMGVGEAPNLHVNTCLHRGQPVGQG